MKIHFFLYLISLTVTLLLVNSCQENITPSPKELKPRLVVMTDIAPGNIEPDDMESAVRLLAYADRFEIEAIVATIGWNCDPYPAEWANYLDTVVEAYSIDVQNLMKRSGQSEFANSDIENGKQELGYWPSPAYIKSRTMLGSARAGIGVIGPDNDSPGSDFLIKLAQEPDDRPIWVTAWGGANTLAQAIWKVSKSATPQQLQQFLQKFRLYTITDQDMKYDMRNNRAYSSHQWLRKEFSENLMLIWDESAWLNQCDLGKQNWQKYAAQIQTKGKLGSVYPNYLWGVEGDTPSFLHLMPNGLNNPDQPNQVGWGGYHVFALSPDSITNAWTNFHNPIKSISDSYERKFYPDEFNDFAARMAWAHEGKGNVNPTIIINGNSSIKPLTIQATENTVVLDASKSFDSDGDEITFNWWVQSEVGDIADYDIDNPSSPIATVKLGNNGKTLHVVLEVHDNSDFNLVSYKRVIINN